MGSTTIAVEVNVTAKNLSGTQLPNNIIGFIEDSANQTVLGVHYFWRRTQFLNEDTFGSRMMTVRLFAAVMAARVKTAVVPLEILHSLAVCKFHGAHVFWWFSEGYYPAYMLRVCIVDVSKLVHSGSEM